MPVIELSLVSLWFVKMAAMFTVKVPLLEFLQEEEHFLYFNARHRAYWSLLRRREWTPKITCYMETVFDEFGLPQNIDDFRIHYRVSRNLFEIILQGIYGTLRLSGTGPHDAVEPQKQLLVCLWYLSNMSSMRELAHIFNMSKSTVHAVVMRVLGALQELTPRVICWPNAERQREIAGEVEDMCGLQGVIGFLDGTHIRLSSALQGDRDFYNRKGFPSIQVQAVVDHEMKFTNIFTGWPGCVHDARVLRNSSLYTEAETGNIVLQDHYILADSAYPLRNWLITPFKNLGNLTPQQVRFNKRLSSARQVVERAFGHLKGRFRRLQDVPLHSSAEICQMILAACILHNLCIMNDDEVEDYIMGEQDPNDWQCDNIYQNGHNGIVRRLQLVNSLNG